jgi:acyl carrier protein
LFNSSFVSYLTPLFKDQMMLHPPSLEVVTAQVKSIIEKSLDEPVDLKSDRPLIGEQGLDSLDMIEAGFALEEFFEFEFAENVAIEELDKALGGGRLIAEGNLTAEGLQAVLQRSPELAHLDLPEGLSLMALQGYYTVETYARLIREFYLALPERDEDSGELIVLEGFKPVTEKSKEAVAVPSGDALIEAWVNATVQDMK